MTVEIHPISTEIVPSSSVPKQDAKLKSKRRKRRKNRQGLSLEKCNCLLPFLAGLVLTILLLAMIFIPFGVSISRSVTTTTPQSLTTEPTSVATTTAGNGTSSITSAISSSTTNPTISSGSTAGINSTSSISGAGVTTTAASATTMTTTNIAYNCTAAAPASLATISGNTNQNWTQAKYNYTANKINSTLVFVVKVVNNIYILLDDISVVDTNDTSTELLQNPSFDNSTSTPPTDWTMWCQSSCSSGLANLTNGAANCITGNCYRDQCVATIGDYLGQSFSTIVGRTYVISFWYRRVRVTGGSTATLYVGII